MHRLGAKPLSKVVDLNNRSNTDYDPQDIFLHRRMVKNSSEKFIDGDVKALRITLNPSCVTL